MMLSFVMQVTFFRPYARAYSKAYRTMFSQPGRVISLRTWVTSGVWRCSMPAYRSSSFSRMMTRFMPGCAEATNGLYDLDGRMLANRFSVFRMVTLTLL